MTNTVTKKKHNKSKKDLIFCIALLIIPIVQFCIFYIGVNFNSIMLSFQDITISEQGEYARTWTFDTMRGAFEVLTSPNFVKLGGVSLLAYALTLAIGVPLALLFSYYIYKKFPLSKMFRVMLFLPSVISNIVIVLIYQFFVERAIPDIVLEFSKQQIDGLISDINTRFATIMFFNIWFTFGTTTLLYSNSMSGISEELVEAARLDGANQLQEFWHISLPMIFPTLETFLVAGIAGIFTNQISLFSFYGNQAPEELQTYGYYLYKSIQMATNETSYPQLAAMGLIFTAIAVPVTLLAKHLLEKYGPSED